MDAYQVWREAEGQSKQRTLRSIWPALAEALDGPGKALGTRDEVQPLCVGCAGDALAIGRAGSEPVCGRCAGREPYRSRTLSRVSAWKAGRP